MNCPCNQCQDNLDDDIPWSTGECEQCERDFEKAEMRETNEGWLCLGCIEENEIMQEERSNHNELRKG